MKALNNKINSDATPAAFNISLTVLSLTPFLNAPSNYYKFNRVDALCVNMFLALLRTRAEMSLSQAKIIFTPRTSTLLRF